MKYLNSPQVWKTILHRNAPYKYNNMLNIYNNKVISYNL